jgi:amino-acid N-acetyltransferase
MSPGRVAPLRIVKRRAPATLVRQTAPQEVVTLRTATVDQVDAIHDLIEDHLDEGRLLPRNRYEIHAHAQRFVVAMEGDRVVGCGELAPLGRSVAEVRSLVVSNDARSLGLGHRIVDEIVQRASKAGFEKLCAFTHSPGYFTRMGFSIIPHVWLPEKIVADCHACDRFRTCGQYAVLRTLKLDRQQLVPLAVQHG